VAPRRVRKYAEVKTLFVDPFADFLAVNRNPCFGCQGTILWRAMAQGTPITILAPKGIYYFLPDGTIITP
jgi:hypothetical protein